MVSSVISLSLIHISAIQRALAQLPPCQGRTVLVSIGKAGWQTAKAAYDALDSTIEHGAVSYTHLLPLSAHAVKGNSV